MTGMNKAMVFTGVVTLLQAASQMLFTTLGILQYFCVIDFLRELPLLIFIKILYFHNPGTCGLRINIGQSIDEMANQAFVLLTSEPFTATRTFIINGTNLGLSALWIITCVGLMSGGAKNKQTKPIRWPWIIVTVAVCGVDLVATVTYANDTFHTRTLSDMMDFVGGIASGTGSLEVDTSWAAWVMVIIYSRFIVFFLLNLFLIVLVILDGSTKPGVENTGIQVEAPTMTDAETSDKDVEEGSLPSESPVARIPRPGLSQSFRRMKARLFNRAPSPAPAPAPVHVPVARVDSIPNSLDASPEISPRSQHVDMDRKRTVNFPSNLLSFPQRLENMIAEQRRRLDKAVVDTAGRGSPPRASQSMPQLASGSSQDIARGLNGPSVSVQASLGVDIVPRRQGVYTERSARCCFFLRRRDTAAELQGQLPWAYIPAPAHRMRDQLPPDEDLPPVPLPDYTALSSFRKASVHRAASSLSSLTQKKDNKTQTPRPPLTQFDVLY